MNAPSFTCPLCDVFPFDTAAALGEHIAAQHSTPAVTGSGRFETVANGFGGTTTRRVAAQPVRGDLATDKQIAYALSLAESRGVLSDGDEQFYRSMSRREISTQIDTLKALARPTAPTSSTPTTQTIEPGMYRVDETIYKVQTARTTQNLYAKRLHEHDGSFSFEYEQGAIRTVRERGVRLTLDEAKQFGQRTGTCCVCAAVLTNPESIELGIGPICGGRI